MEHAHQIICMHNTPDVTHKLGQVQAKVLCPHPSPMHSLFPHGRTIKQIHGPWESIFFIKQYFTWVEEVLFILSKRNQPTLGIWYHLILRYWGSFFEDCRQLIFFCCNLIPKGEEQKKTLKGQIQPSSKEGDKFGLPWHGWKCCFYIAQWLICVFLTLVLCITRLVCRLDFEYYN